MQENIVKKERFLWLDYAKCLSMFAVVILHTFDQVLGYYVVAWASSFALQLFFMISGYLTKEQEAIRETFQKCVKGILVPYLAFHLIILIFYFGTQAVFGTNFSLTFGTLLKKSLLGILLAEGRPTDYSINLNSPLWFLPCIFICKMFFQLIIRDKKYLYHKLLLVLVVSVISTFLFQHYSINIYFCIDSALMGMSFYVFGFLLKRVDKGAVQDFSKNKALILGLSLFIVNILLSNYNQADYNRVSMNACTYGNNLILFYIDALAGAFAILFISIFLSSFKIKILYYLGQNTLVILGVHYTFIKYLKMLESHILSDIFGSTSFNPVVMYINNFIICILVMFMCIPVIYIIRKYFPFMIGDFRTKKMTPVA